jgi:hypothetical protein
VAYLHWVMCDNIKHTSMWIEHPRLFQNNNIYYLKYLNIGTHDNTSFALNNDKNNHILIACDNKYTMESKDELEFVKFFFIQYLLSFVTNIACDLFKATKGILFTNVAYNSNLIIKTSRK